MSDFAHAYFSAELEKLDVPTLEEIFKKVQSLLDKKRTAQDNAPDVNEAEIARINAVYDTIPADKQRAAAAASMRAMWETLKHDSW